MTSATVLHFESQSRIKVNSPELSLQAGTGYHFQAAGNINFEAPSLSYSTTTGSGSASFTAGSTGVPSSKISFASVKDTLFQSTTSSVLLNSEDNILARTVSSIEVKASAVSMIAERGSQLYYSTSPGTPKDLSITSDTTSIEFRSFETFRTREHQNLGFFYGSSPTAKSNPTSNSMALANLNVVDFNNALYSPCRYTVIDAGCGGGSCTGQFHCPQVSSRTFQLANALVNYGLMRFV